MTRLLEIGIRILRLHRALHEGGKKRCRLPREDAPRLIRAAFVGDVPTSVSCCLFGIACGSRTAGYNKGCLASGIRRIGIMYNIVIC